MSRGVHTAPGHSTGSCKPIKSFYRGFHPNQMTGVSYFFFGFPVLPFDPPFEGFELEGAASCKVSTCWVKSMPKLHPTAKAAPDVLGLLILVLGKVRYRERLFVDNYIYSQVTSSASCLPGGLGSTLRVTLFQGGLELCLRELGF